ncbi:PP2C family protein-serine/threonine phosphatase [Candidatus Frankia alpina]|uniref:Serine/threonine-protein phosphatase n=1 Tax=Candidatus Frankia alpina TaxID=2699483 RepID=A0A4S5EBS9_9ACTN|nr:PP2C family protein-serine/threonine phosphatase [Candidatus Frankia alpina]THJ69093.1 serine/threonine-protein phosphatase [Candidatus Frankia alpina]
MRSLVPLVVLLAVVAMDLTGDQRYVIITSLVISPLLAAALTGPWVTAAYAGAALLLGALQAIPLGYYSGVGHDSLVAQMIRLAVIAAGGAIAVAASRDRQRREARLRDVTRVADVAQRAILGVVPARVGDLRLAVSYDSAAAQARVGGDLYEVAQTRWGVRILVGDARGKGLDAARLASRVLATFRVVARHLADAEEVVAALDAEVVRSGGAEDFVTAVFAQLDGAQLELVNAGHPDPVLLRRGAPRLLDATGRRTPLGLGAAGATVVRTHLVAGDRILFYTDGMAEARHPRTREFFPVLPAVQAAFRPARRLDACLADLVAALRRWTEATLGDDVALLAAEFAPPARAEAPCADQPAQVRADAPWRAPDGKREVPRPVTGFTNGADDARRHHGDGPARADITTARRREAIG